MEDEVKEKKEKDEARLAFGKRLHVLRVERHLSCSDVSKVLGFSHSLLSGYENMTCLPSKQRAQLLFDYYKDSELAELYERAYKLSHDNKGKKRRKRGRHIPLVEGLKCPTCRYRSDRMTEYTCDYILFTGHQRGCDPKNCDKYVEGDRLRMKEDNPWKD